MNATRIRPWRLSLLAGVFVICAAPQRLQADTTWTVTGSDSYRSAAAVFTLNSSAKTLTILLTNTSENDVLAPSDVLTGLFFDTSKDDLKPVKAEFQGSQQDIYYGAVKENVGEGWAYAHGPWKNTKGDPIDAQGKNSGISAAGLDLFGPKDPFFSSNPVLPLDGLNYGILSHGFDPSGEHTNLTGKGPLFKNSILFTLTAAEGFSLDSIFLDSGGNPKPNAVVFQYGTSLDDPWFYGEPVAHDGNVIVGTSPVPEASSLLLLAFGGLPLLALRRKRA
jgi:hypothetical protein